MNKFQNKFHGEESSIYNQHLTSVQKSYNDLVVKSNKRLADLEMLQDFIQSATTELIWLNEKEEIEISRDWSSKSLNITEIERYYEVFPTLPPPLHVAKPIIKSIFVNSLTCFLRFQAQLWNGIPGWNFHWNIL